MASGVEEGCGNFPCFSFNDKYGSLFWAYAFTRMRGIDLGKFRAKIQDEGGIVNPGEHNDNGSRGSIGHTQIGPAQVESDEELASQKEDSRKDGSYPCIFPGNDGIGQYFI